ncbi:hypothetical protein G9A89_019119 [Geosiphon pyriformis]|nr:hypothetical protein G9A89_019119 [Geosiphon pyriformis]
MPVSIGSTNPMLTALLIACSLGFINRQLLIQQLFETTIQSPFGLTSSDMNGYQFAYSSAPLRRVKYVQFGILSPDEIVSFAALLKSLDFATFGYRC